MMKVAGVSGLNSEETTCSLIAWSISAHSVTVLVVTIFEDLVVRIDAFPLFILAGLACSVINYINIIQKYNSKI